MNALFAAVAAFQAEAPKLHKDAVNPHFRSKYASLDGITAQVKPLLAKHGLVWMTLPGSDPTTGNPDLAYCLGHAESGEQITGRMPLFIGKADAQGYGSALTYARRYAVCSVLDLVAEDDDDGNGASRPADAAPARPQRSHDGGQGKASEKQHNFLVALLKKHHLTAAAIRHELMESGVSVPAAANVVDVVEGLTGKEASAVIEKLKDRPVEPVAEAPGSPVAKELFDVPKPPPSTGHYGEEGS